MAEPEDLISDAARHATIFAQKMWQRHRSPPDLPVTIKLGDVTTRIGLLITAAFDTSLPIRVAQLPPLPTFLSRVLKRNPAPRHQHAIPATDGLHLWLPSESGETNIDIAASWFKVLALQQATRATRGAAELLQEPLSPLLRDVYLLLEAYAADEELAQQLPGMTEPINRLRQQSLEQRPPLAAFSVTRQPLERFLRVALASKCGYPDALIPLADTPAASLANAKQLIQQRQFLIEDTPERNLGLQPLLKDYWTGELRLAAHIQDSSEVVDTPVEDDDSPTRSAQLQRRPEVRQPKPDEDEGSDETAPLMVQMDEPHQQAEDPMGLQRPTDRDQETSADEFGDMLSDLPEARLVATPGRAKEVLLSDDPPDGRARAKPSEAAATEKTLQYPEWDFRTQIYHTPGAKVWLLPEQLGSQQWVDDTLKKHRAMLDIIRRRFEMLQANRVWKRHQTDGDEIDLDAYISSYASYRAGSPMSDGLYQSRRPAERHMAITLLIDISGSTDSWISSNRRILDVEREALLLVGVALESLREPWSVQAFSGEGPGGVTVRQLKGFTEPYGNEIALRISSLEPEHYTRAGAAIRHASSMLMQQPASHRLLLLLSDGKPNDIDHYEGRYGVEDMRQAIIEAKLQGISPFCLTVDRQAQTYLPRIFGAGHYALLPRPERLPTVLLEWVSRLVVV